MKNNKKCDLNGWWDHLTAGQDAKARTCLDVIGIVFGVLLGVAILGYLFYKFVVDPHILKPIRKKQAQAHGDKIDKEIAEMNEEEAREKTCSSYLVTV